MPDVGRSDSQRSDSSQRPRVSFNRDVHIKRIGRSEGGVVAALTSDGEGHLIATPVRRERGQRSRSELAKEAALILKQADQVQSITAVPPGGIPPSSYNSLDRSKLRKRKTPVQQLFSEENKDLKNNEKFNTGRRLTRSVSDVGKGSLRNKYKDKRERDESEDRKRDEKKLSIFATLDRRLRKGRKENEKPSHKNEKLSPILEDENNKGNPFNFPPKIIIEPSTPIDERYKYNNEYQNQLSSYKFNKTIDEKPPPRRKLKENFQRTHSPKNVDENEESGQDTYSTISVNEFYDSKGKKSKSLLKDLHKKNISNNKHPINNEGKFQKFDDKMYDNFSVSNEKDTQEKRKDVKRIVRELSQRDTLRISPPKSSINALVDPTVDADRQHNMNRPFSYIHPNTSPTDTDQVIYAQVVCTGGDKPNEEVIKRTIHTTVDRRINTGIEEDEGGQLEEDANMKINDNNILDHLSLRRDRLESRIDSHKRRFQQNLLHNTSNNYNENRYIVSNDTGTVDNLGSITDLTTKDRYFEHHIKTTASFRHKEFLSDSPSPTAIDHKQRHSSNSEYSYKQHNKRQDQRQQKQLDDDYYHIQHSKQQQQQNKSNEKNNKDVRKKTTKLDKVRQLVSWNKKNKSQTSSSEETDPVKARYMEYKGNNYSNENNVKDAEYYANRRRAATPVKNDSTWFKSLTRRSKQKDRKVATPLPEEDSVDYQSDRHYGGSKTLRFFGDSDKESFQSSNTSHQQMRNSRVRPPPDSSAESTLEDESGQSQKSVVYLHAAAVGDIPGSRKLHRSQLSNGRRALSREELSSNGSTTFVPHTRTLSRSISVLAPWKPRHPRDGIEVNYNDAGKPPRAPIKTATKTPSKPEKKKHKDGTLGRRGSDESKKSSSAFSQESASSSRRNNYNMDTVDSNTNSLNRKLKKTNSENDLTNSTQTVHGHSKTAGWFRSRK